MKQITIQIPDKQASFMLELLQKFDFVKINGPISNNEFGISESQKKSIETERINCKNDSNYLLD